LIEDLGHAMADQLHFLTGVTIASAGAPAGKNAGTPGHPHGVANGAVLRLSPKPWSATGLAPSFFSFSKAFHLGSLQLV